MANLHGAKTQKMMIIIITITTTTITSFKTSNLTNTKKSSTYYNFI
jgi:hypothetical protein